MGARQRLSFEGPVSRHRRDVAASPLPGAKVTVACNKTPTTRGVTNSEGRYRIVEHPDAGARTRRRLTISKSGFALVNKTVRVSASQSQHDLMLERALARRLTFVDALGIELRPPDPLYVSITESSPSAQGDQAAAGSMRWPEARV